MTEAPQASPRNVIVVLLDSLNRHMLSTYGGQEFDTPNLDRFAARSVRLDRHVTGSLPCIPARHDILCGAWDFLWKPWGSIEVWEEAVTAQLREAGVTSMLVTDHPHLFESGGENYHADFFAWDYVRGHEGDPWRTRPDPSWAGTPALPAGTRFESLGPRLRALIEEHFGELEGMPYDRSRTYFREEVDFPGPKTMQATADWIRDHARAHERFFLFVDEFDPHEPFDAPPEYVRMYDPDWTGPLIIWPPYSTSTLADGILDERQARHVRAMYGAKLTMIDRWFGKVLDEIDAAGLWDDTAVFVTADHGHYLGERDFFGKPSAPVYNELGHIPLLVAWPGAEPRSVGALSTSVDLHATIAEVFGVSASHRTHGVSLVPLVTGAAETVREWAIGGYWGHEVHVLDATHKYVRAPVGDNFPLSMWSNRWSTMPTHFPGMRLPPPDDRAWLDHMPGSAVPVIRQPFRPGDMLPMWRMMGNRAYEHLLFDHTEDPSEQRSLAGTAAEQVYVDLVRHALEEVEAPGEQFERLGLR